MTIGVPGNVPYIITVGAMTDNYTPADGTDDFLASFSAAGPTVEGFVKPELVAPGGRPERGEPLASQSQNLSGLGALGHLELDLPFQGRHVDLGAQ